MSIQLDRLPITGGHRGVRPVYPHHLTGMSVSAWFLFALLACQILVSIASAIVMTADDPLMDPATLRVTSVAELLSEAPRVVESATAADKALIRDALEQVYVAETSRTAGLSFQQLQELQRFYRYLRAGETDRGPIVAVWLDQSAEAATLTFRQQVWLLDQFEAPSPGVATVGTLKNRVLGQIDSASAGRLTTRQLASAVRALSPHLAETEKLALSQTLGQRWAAQIDSNSPFNLTDSRKASALRAWQAMFDLLDDGETGPSQYIDHLPDYLAKMTAIELYWRFRYEYVELLAQPIRTQPARDALLAKAQAAGPLRQDVLQVLSSSYRQAGESDGWNQQLDSLIADPGLTDDRHAQWMIAKAYSLALTDDTHQPTPLLGQPLLRDAMELAQTDETRMACLRQIVLNNLAYFLFDQARADVAKYSTSFSTRDAEAMIRLETMILMLEHIADQIAATENVR